MELLLRALLCVLLLVSPAIGESSAAKSKRGTPFHQLTNPPAKTVNLEPQFFPQYNSKRVEIQYGPFKVQSMADSNGMVDYLSIPAAQPCWNCTITYVHAGLTYPNGTYANANTSLWLHHIVLLNLGKKDVVCPSNYQGAAERWFASGNERTPADFTIGGKVPAGYKIGPEDALIMLVELMNQGMDTQMAVPTITFEYIQDTPDFFFSAIPVWMDIGGCGNSDQPAKSPTTFSYTSPKWKSNLSGAILGMAGHLHDGGTNLQIFQNDKEICNSVPTYGASPGYWDAPGTSMVMPMDPNFAPMSHISNMTKCYAPTVEVKPGDEYTITANYNFTEYSPMLNTDGSFADIMGISLIFIAENVPMAEIEQYTGSKVKPLDKTPMPTAVAVMDMNMDEAPSGAADMGMAGMYCIPSRDSPGTITTNGLDMSKQSVAMDYLMAILNDTCLQVWSGAYARYFWYGIATVIGLFTLVRLLDWTKLTLRKRNAAANRQTSGGLSRLLFAPIGEMGSALRTVAYPQITPAYMTNLVKLPAFGTILMVLVYFGFVLVLQFMHTSTGDDQTYQSLGVRAAWLSVAQVPLIVLLASKRNLIGFFTAITYERLNVLHRWVARGLLMTASMHFGFQSYGWARAGVMQLEWATDLCPPTGIAAYAVVLWMNLTTLAPFRNFRYEFFVIQHIISFICLITAVMYHIPTTALYARTYIWIAIGLYLFSRLVQTAYYFYYNLTPSKAIITPISEAVTKVTIKNRKVKSWTPGSFILLGIPRYGVLQSHPATLASTPTSHGGDMVFYLRKRTGFTKKIAADAAHTADHTALIDGPYGGTQSDFAAFHSVVLVAGSTGVSFTLPILLDIAARATTTRLPVQEIRFVWAMKDQAFVAELGPELRKAIAALRTAGINVSVQVHVTGAYEPSASTFHETEETTTPSNGVFAQQSASEKSETSSNSSRDGDLEKTQVRATHERTTSDRSSDAGKAMSVAAGRPALREVLRDAKSYSAGEMAVAVCGPLSLSKDVRNHVAGMELAGFGQDVYLHVEGYGW